MSVQRNRRSFTFVELIAAIAILAITIVPATQYLAGSMTLRRRLERRRCGCGRRCGCVRALGSPAPLSDLIRREDGQQDPADGPGDRDEIQ